MTEFSMLCKAGLGLGPGGLEAWTLPFCGSEAFLLEAGLSESTLPSWLPVFGVGLWEGVGREEMGTLSSGISDFISQEERTGC